MVAQYVVKQGFVHLGYSGGWCFRGFVRRFYGLLARLGFEKGLYAWRFLLRSLVIPSEGSFDLIIAPVERGGWF